MTTDQDSEKYHGCPFDGDVSSLESREWKSKSKRVWNTNLLLMFLSHVHSTLQYVVWLVLRTFLFRSTRC
jgi:hypothetical protein